MKTLFNRKYKFKTLMLFGFIMFLCGLTIFVSASSYNSEEISYDTSTSGAVQANVKDALDFLYSHSLCGEGMSCFESPDVTINVSGPGEVSEANIKVPVYGRKQVTVIPDSGYVLRSFSCNNGYTLTDFKTLTILAADPQNIEIINSGILTDATCEANFGLNELVELKVSSTLLDSTYKNDTCNSNESGCICYQIKNNVTNFTYGSHTGCNFKSGSQTCYYTTQSGDFSCNHLIYSPSSFWIYYDSYTSRKAACSGVITCVT